MSDPTRQHRALVSGELANPWPLDEFLEALGPVLRLPPKEREPSRPSARLPGRRRRRPVVLAAVALALLGTAAAAPLISGALRDIQDLPPGLHGRWGTAAESHAGRSFELSATSLRLGAGVQGTTYPITGVESRDSAGAVVYTIAYRDGESELEFAFAVGPDSVARVRNLPQVAWTKSPQ